MEIRERGGQQHDHGMTTTHATLPSSTCWCWERNEEDFFLFFIYRVSNNPQEKVKYRRRRDVWPCNFTGMHNNDMCMPKIPEDDKQQKKKFRLEDIFGFFLFPEKSGGVVCRGFERTARNIIFHITQLWVFTLGPWDRDISSSWFIVNSLFIFNLKNGIFFWFISLKFLIINDWIDRIHCTKEYFVLHHLFI